MTADEPIDDRRTAEPSYDRKESRAEQLDRNWNELLQEIRVMQTGSQILAAFLIILPFQQRFDDLEGFQIGWYLGLLLLSLLIVAILLTPVSVHRVHFRKRVKDEMVSVAARLLKVGLVLLAFALAGVAVLIFDFVIGDLAAAIAGSATLLAGLFLIVVLPRLVLRNREDREDHDEDAPPRRTVAARRDPTD